MPSSLTPQEFVARWKPSKLTERSSSQSHFIDLCALLGEPTPVEADPTGTSYTFEKGASGGSAKGGQGYADVWKRHYFAWEYKRKGGDLKGAYTQLQRYREALENPPLMVVSDMETIEIHTNFTNTVAQVYTLTLDDLLDPSKLVLLKKVFTDPDSLKANTKTTSEVTEQAAKEFSKLAEIIRRQGVQPPKAAHFLIRLLFCLFAEDIELLPKGLFTRLVGLGYKRPKEYFAGRLRELFSAMSTGGTFGPEDIAHFNGGLFDSDDVIELNNEAMEILLRVAKLDWSNMEPAILGTLFERSLDPSKRSQLGAHYTSKDDILLIVEPVLMSPLRRRWEEVKEKAVNLAAKSNSSSNARAKANTETELRKLLLGFADEIAAIKVLDPACGSGNFLYVALKQLLDLQKEVVILASSLGLPRFFPTVLPEQLYGIEVNEYAYELAQTTVWIGYIQWLRDNGFGQPAEPILKPLKAISNMDSILGYDGANPPKPVEPGWPKANVIIGNPPFLGGKRLRTQLGDKYVNDLFKVYTERVARQSDLVCYWFEKARHLLEAGEVDRVGLIATQAIRGGANRIVLERIKQTGDIFMAWSDREWYLEGAAVHVSMIGFDNGSEASKVLNGAKVTTINANLTSALDLTKAKRLNENLSLAFMGDTKVGPFDIPDSVAQTMLAAKGNPNGLPNSDVIRPWVNGKDITSRPRNMWIIDFGLDMSEEDAAQYEKPFEYAHREIKPFRAKAKSGDQTGIPWWIHQRPRPELRTAVARLKKFIVTTRVSKHRIFNWAVPNVIPDSAVIAIARDDDYFFGVVHSKVHELWARGQGTQLREVESGFRYTPTTTFETFPFPWAPGTELESDPKHKGISEAAKDLVKKRDNWLNPTGATDEELKTRTLTNLYNQRPTWLDLAHKKLDDAVLDAYGWPHDLSDEEILERLLALNLEHVAAQGGEVSAPSLEDTEVEE